MGTTKDNEFDFLKEPSKPDEFDFLRKPEVLDEFDFLRQPEPEPIQPPDISNLLRLIPEDATDIDIELPGRETSNIFTKLSHLIGAEQGFNQVLASDSYNRVDEMATRMENSGNILNQVAAGQLRSNQGAMLVGGVLMSVGDYEERPRKAFFNILALHTQRRMDKVKYPGKIFDPLTMQDYRKAVGDGWDTKQRLGSVKTVVGLITPAQEVAWEKFLARYPSFAKVANAFWITSLLL